MDINFSTTDITGLANAAAASDTDTIAVNQGAGNLKQTFTAVKTWITNWLASASLTWSGKTLTTPTINGGTLGGTFSGAHTYSGLPTVSVGSSTSNTDFQIWRPTDWGAGKPYLYIIKALVATQYNIGLYDSVGNTGTINVSATSFSWNGSQVADLGTSQTFSGAKVFSLPPVLPSYTVATVPSAATYARGEIYVSNETGGAVTAFSDGTNWRRVTDRAIVA